MFDKRAQYTPYGTIIMITIPTYYLIFFFFKQFPDNTK